MSTAKLIKAYAKGEVTVVKHKKVTGEVQILFNNKELPPIYINSYHPVKLTALPKVTVTALQKSNLGKLVTVGELLVVQGE